MIFKLLGIWHFLRTQSNPQLFTVDSSSLIWSWTWFQALKNQKTRHHYHKQLMLAHTYRFWWMSWTSPQGPDHPFQRFAMLVGFPLPRVLHCLMFLNDNYHYFAIHCNVSKFTILVTHFVLDWVWLLVKHRCPTLHSESSHSSGTQVCHHPQTPWLQIELALLSLSTIFAWMPLLVVLCPPPHVISHKLQPSRKDSICFLHES